MPLRLSQCNLPPLLLQIETLAGLLLVQRLAFIRIGLKSPPKKNFTSQTTFFHPNTTQRNRKDMSISQNLISKALLAFAGQRKRLNCKPDPKHWAAVSFGLPQQTCFPISFAAEFSCFAGRIPGDKTSLWNFHVQAAYYSRANSAGFMHASSKGGFSGVFLFCFLNFQEWRKMYYNNTARQLLLQGV